MKIQSIGVSNFRKFREPLTVGGFQDGLNIVVEPNETGKSTLLEALRAALFIRHSAKSELVRSFCPFGDDVAPKVAVEFSLDADAWRVEKQFLKAPFVSLEGPSGRFESDAAEDKLQELLGFEKGNNRGSDPETRGALGLLWVEQASALTTEAPGRLVRDNVRGALENEVGAILGGRRFDVVKARIDEAYATLRTARSGKSTGRLADAEARLAEARAHSVASEALLGGYEQALTQLEAARTAKRLLERDIADPEQAERKQKLEDDFKIAETAQIRLSAAQARHAEAEGLALKSEALLTRFDEVARAAETMFGALETADAALAGQQSAYSEAQTAECDARATLSSIRARRADAEQAVTEARKVKVERTRHAAVRRARSQLTEVIRLESEVAKKNDVAKAGIDTAALEKLRLLDRGVTEAQAIFEAGAVAIDIELLGETALEIDGRLVVAGRHEIVRSTDIMVGNIAKLRVTPPAVGGRSAEANLQSASDALVDACKSFGVDSYAAAVRRSEEARSAQQEIVALKREIDVLCPGDASIELESGPAALKTLLIDFEESESEAVSDDIDLTRLEAAVMSLRDEEQVAAVRLEASQTQLHAAEVLLTKLQTERAGAARESLGANDTFIAFKGTQDREEIVAALADARQELGRRAEALGQAKEATATFDVDRIRRSIANIQQAQARAGEERIALVAQIASLESTIAADGPKGLAGMAAEAHEAEQAAEAEHKRLSHEADMLELLRSTLQAAGDEASRTFLEPITRRAARYVERILPGCGLAFDQQMGLTAVMRSGINEACGDLSRGTQEQLAVLTRLAFADLLLDRGAPVSLILDDPLVYSDDGRFEIMTDILLEAAERMQVVLLTCRSKAFRHVAGHHISLQ
jgi:hypothetical protein